MSGNGKEKVAKMQSKYITEQELTDLASATKRKRLYRRLVAFAIFAGLFSFSIMSTLISQNSVIEAKQAEKERLERELLSLEKEQVILEEEIVKLNDDEYLAKLARRDYFLSDENEIIFNLPNNELEKTSEESSY